MRQVLLVDANWKFMASQLCWLWLALTCSLNDVVIVHRGAKDSLRQLLCLQLLFFFKNGRLAGPWRRVCDNFFLRCLCRILKVYLGR